MEGRVRFHFELAYLLNREFLIDYKATSANYETRFSYSALEGSINLRYYFPISYRIELIGQIGIGDRYLFQSTKRRISEQFVGEDIFILNEDDSFDLNKTEFFISQGVIANCQGVIANYRTNSGITYFVEVGRKTGITSIIESEGQTNYQRNLLITG